MKSILNFNPITYEIGLKSEAKTLAILNNLFFNSFIKKEELKGIDMESNNGVIGIENKSTAYTYNNAMFYFEEDKNNDPCFQFDYLKCTTFENKYDDKIIFITVEFKDELRFIRYDKTVFSQFQKGYNKKNIFVVFIPLKKLLPIKRLGKQLKQIAFSLL